MELRSDLAAGLAATPARRQATEQELHQKAKDLEASFLSEMLKYTGVGKPRESFGGGAGEEQFSSFLCDEYARIMTEAGGIGLAETIFRSLQKGAQNAG